MLRILSMKSHSEVHVQTELRHLSLPILNVSGLDTLVGVTLSSLEQGSQPEAGKNIYEDGDSNQARNSS